MHSDFVNGQSQHFGPITPKIIVEDVSMDETEFVAVINFSFCDMVINRELENLAGNELQNIQQLIAHFINLFKQLF
jgi:hypothetical protein